MAKPDRIERIAPIPDLPGYCAGCGRFRKGSELAHVLSRYNRDPLKRFCIDRRCEEPIRCPADAETGA
ncbi:MAG: hypothetical protein FJZ00_04505 [Candidatus Sericytochromatia bacterium]|uniref:Uncharacterized protein n=1 Tax=Candidatus Tanganyikabacteria bacterium TaxID=2961651 RepID=A0A937X1X3_9BACT|nr:hypothetical protein [Candidatus Tanganyikabacteria bacterium]